jgi:hypothetical protein
MAFMLCLSFFPFAYINSGRLNLNVKFSDSLVKDRTLQLHIYNNPILADVPEKESVTNHEIIQILNRSILNSRKLIINALNMLLLPIIDTLLFAAAFLYACRKFNKKISEIANFIGGHAPPILIA